jgi:hypothetical protein
MTKSDRLAKMIWAMKAAEREAVAHVAVFCLSKDNIAPVGTGRFPRIVGMAGPIAQMMAMLGQAGGMSGDWTLCEAPITKSGKLAVLLFRGTEEDVCSEIVKLVEVAKVQTA